MKRPSFQFYAGDWQANTNLRRCSSGAKGAWIDAMCLMHDSDEYGVLRWPLTEIARATGHSVTLLKELASKGVLKGVDGGQCPGFIFTPRHAGRDGDPVTLIAEQKGPLWYSSRMVRDEHIRRKRGEGSFFGGSPNSTPKGEPNSTPKAGFGDGPSSSSASSSSNHDDVSPLADGTAVPDVLQFVASIGLDDHAKLRAGLAGASLDQVRSLWSKMLSRRPEKRKAAMAAAVMNGSWRSINVPSSHPAAPPIDPIALIDADRLKKSEHLKRNHVEVSS